MKKSAFILALILACAMFLRAPSAYPQEPSDILLKDIAADMATYRGRTMVLRLKLKNADFIFHKLVFYDRKNHDIIFDISGKEKDRQFQKRMLNLHSGMEYVVTFTVSDSSALGYVIGELSDFLPVALTRLPEAPGGPSRK